jgi:hypothetical protein
MDHRYMNVETGTEAAQFPAKESINGIFVAVQNTFHTIHAITNARSKVIAQLTGRAQRRRFDSLPLFVLAIFTHRAAAA